MSSLHSPVSTYYDQNTAPFLRWFGSGFEVAAIHRQVWAPGVHSGREAFEYLNLRVADLTGLRNLSSLANVHILDLGCGLGGTATWIAQRFKVTVTGLTVSSVQALFANERAARRQVARRCRFIWSDFLRLPDLGSFGAAWAIESFAHAADAERFFREAARVLAPGARLVVCDDFLAPASAQSPSAEAARWLEEFRAGWRLSSLVTVGAANELATRHGFRLLQDDDLTAYLRLAPAWYLNLLEPVLHLPLNMEYVRSLRGSLALQKCLHGGWTQYHALAWEKANDS